MTIKELVAKYEGDRLYYLSSQYSEAQLRNDFLDIFFELLGWDIKNNACKPTYEREVIIEEPIKENVSTFIKKPDYTFRQYKERKFFLEAKKPSLPIETNDSAALQVRRYGFTAKLKISVLSNFEYLIIYDTSIKVDNGDHCNKALLKRYHYTEYENNYDEIKQLLGKDAVYSGIFDAEWEEINDRINQYSIDNLFIDQINVWRKLLGAEIYKNNNNIDENLLNDITQSYINRIIFLRVCEDRNIEDYQTLLSFANDNDFNSLINKFKQADKRYNSGLFNQLLSDVIIKNISSTFWTIIKQLYYPESPYSFCVLSSDILGRIYEIFLCERLKINDGIIILEKKPEYIDRDIITTPNFIISDILRNTVLKKCEDKTDNEILQLKFADISCGSGAFLLELFQLLNDILIDYYLKYDKAKLIKTNINTYKLPYKTKRELLLACIFGVDKDFNAIEVTKFALLLKILEGEDEDSIVNIKPALPDLSHNIFFGNSLLNHNQVPNNEEVINPFDFCELKFDVIIGNPPYMKSEDMKNITPLEFPLYKQYYESAFKQFDKYFLFIEQGINLLNSDGILGYIVPSKFTKVGAGIKLRNLITKNEYLQSIVSFGANQIFADRTTYTCLLILEKKAQSTFKYIEVKNLKNWKVRKQYTNQYTEKNTKELDQEVWILVDPDLINAYNKILGQSDKLVDLVGEDNIFNGIQTSKNSVYVFVPNNEDNTYYYFSKNHITYKIEKEITKPYFHTTAGIDNLYTYRTFKPNAKVIYPYQKTPNGVELIPLTSIQKKYPFAYQYLITNKDTLSDIDIKPIPNTDNEWYRYGRSQCLDSCGCSMKIIVGVLSVGDKYAIDFNGTFISSGGTAGYCVIALPIDSKYSIYYIQAILNSKYLEWFSSLSGEVFRGGYIARGTKVLKNLPIRKINFSNIKEKSIHDEIAKKQKELIEIYDKIDLNIRNRRALIPLQRKFKLEKEKLNNMLAQLYDLGDDDILIPLIKELYETN